MTGMDKENGKLAWGLRTDQVLQALAVDAARGLDESEALLRRRRFGRNRLQAAKPRRLLSILAAQFKSIVIVLLVVAGGLALLFVDFLEAAAIGAVILINTAIGFVSEWRATRSMEALQRFARVTCVLLRAGEVRRVAAEELVPGDIVLLEAGDLVPADLRLIEAAKLGVNESTLTGESLPVNKHTDPLPVDTSLLERTNMAFKGSAITRGTGRGVVVETGMRTEFGKIFEQVSEGKEQRTPLERRLDALGGRLAWAVIVIGILIAGGGIMAGRDAILAVEVAIALSVAAIPEGLPIVATIALARGMWRMARRNALVTKLAAVETLGATSVILTDKTGTLTENRMAATIALLSHADIALDRPAEPASSELLNAMLTTAALCNNATLPATDTSGESTIGDPTEVALLVAASRHGIHRDTAIARWPEIREDAFDPDGKRMATVHRANGNFVVAVKGAPETVLAICCSVHTEQGAVPLTDQERQHWLDRVAKLCQRGQRAIAMADKIVVAADDDVYSDLILYGVVGLEDPAREGVGEAIEQCRAAGVSVVMVTGDHADTARNIAQATGILDETSDAARFLDGGSVDRLLNEGRREELRAVRVFSRVTPEQKLRLIDFYQHDEHVVAMTGDGVNDAPALQKADIGIAMGVRGTAVAKEASDMVLQDDEFGSIVAAVGYGRIIFENIRKFVIYLLSCNISEVLVVSLATIAGAPLPLLPLQILFLNLVTDVFPALALGVGAGDDAMMKSKPRPPGERILMRRHWTEIGLYGLILALVVLAAMAISLRFLDYGQEQAITVAFSTIAFAQLWHVFNMRRNLRHIVVNEITRNIWVWLALILCVLLILVVMHTPALAAVMQLTRPDPSGWLLIIASSVVPLVAAPLVRRIAASSPGESA
jgi:Ca2+-transporting ATPase